MNLIIEHPITAFCTACGFEIKGSKNSYPDICPNCKVQGKTRHGLKLLPVDKVFMSKGNYHLNKDEKQPCYNFSFVNAPQGTKRQFVIDANYEFDLNEMTVLKAAETLKTIIDKYMINPDKPDIAKVVEYLKQRETINEVNIIRNHKTILESEIFWFYTENKDIFNEENSHE